MFIIEVTFAGSKGVKPPRPKVSMAGSKGKKPPRPSG